MRSKWVVPIVVAVLGVTGADVSASPVLDQSNLGDGTLRSTIYDGRETAQTFTVGVDGILHSIVLDLWYEDDRPIPTQPIKVDIRTTTSEGLPGPAVQTLASVMFDTSALTSIFTLYTIDFSSFSLPLHTGDQLAIVLSASGDLGRPAWRGQFYNPYAGGAWYFNVGPGTPWTTKNYDGYFQTYVIPTPADTAPPTITIDTPADGAAYLLNEAVLADWTAVDSDSGLASAVGTVANGQPIDTSAVGTKTFTVTAADSAGNSAERTVTYHVFYGFSGLQAPYREGETFKAGKTILLPWQYQNAAGDVVPSSDASPQAWFTLVDTWTSEEEATPITAPGNSGCQYDSMTSTWQQNWKTTGLAQGTYFIWITCASGQCNGPYPVVLR